MPKDVESLTKSREQRASIIERFGQVPDSILRHDKTIKAIDLMAETRSYKSTSNVDASLGGAFTISGKGATDHHRLDKTFDVSGQSCRGVGGALSRFPQNIGRTLLLLYTKHGDIVVDPFAGHNSRMELCWRAGRHYIGQDLSATFMEANRQIRDLLLQEKADDLFSYMFDAEVTLFEGDSRTMQCGDAVGDFTITSPPYWDIEYYGDEKEQLGRGTYEEFMHGLRNVAKENFRCLKPGAFCVWCVNDFRKGGKFYNYHGHTIQLLMSAGFVQHDIAITDLGAPIRAAFAQQVIDTQILPKRHEYALIFKKP